MPLSVWLATVKSTIDSNWKVKCLFESQIVPGLMSFNLAAMMGALSRFLLPSLGSHPLLSAFGS